MLTVAILHRSTDRVDRRPPRRHPPSLPGLHQPTLDRHATPSPIKAMNSQHYGVPQTITLHCSLLLQNLWLTTTKTRSEWFAAAVQVRSLAPPAGFELATHDLGARRAQRRSGRRVTSTRRCARRTSRSTVSTPSRTLGPAEAKPRALAAPHPRHVFGIARPKQHCGRWWAFVVSRRPPEGLPHRVKGARTPPPSRSRAEPP